MSGHSLAFPDFESAAIKEQYPDPDDTRLLKRFQANWIKYNEYWDTDTKRELLGLISGGDVKTNETNRSGPSGHKFWKRKDELTWALWIAMRTHYGIEKLAKLQAKLAVQFPKIAASSWVCPDQQLEGIQMANAESDDGPLCIKPEEHSGKPLQGSLATSQGGEADDLEAQTHTDLDSRKRAHSGTPGGPQRAKRTAVPSKTHPPTPLLQILTSQLGLDLIADACIRNHGKHNQPGVAILVAMRKDLPSQGYLVINLGYRRRTFSELLCFGSLLNWETESITVQ